MGANHRTPSTYVNMLRSHGLGIDAIAEPGTGRTTMSQQNDSPGTDPPRPTALVSAAVEALATQFFEPLTVSDLLRDAWEGATAALVRAGRSFAPPRPEYPRDPAAAYALHDPTFPKLERQADGNVTAITPVPRRWTAAPLRQVVHPTTAAPRPQPTSTRWCSARAGTA